MRSIVHLILFCLQLFASQNISAQLRLSSILVEGVDVNVKNRMGKQGLWYTYDKVDSTVFSKLQYINDTLNGNFEYYWLSTGKVSEQGFYHNGVLDSTFTAYWESGQVRGVCNYKNGLLDGLVTSYSKEGTVNTKLMYKNGDLDSTYAEMYINPTLEWDVNHPIKMDTSTKDFSCEWNRKVTIYKNDTIDVEIDYYKNRPAIKSLYSSGQLTKRLIFLKVSPYTEEKIHYFQDGNLVKTEYIRKRKKKRTK
jgi:antitoxin component YwqK of YwqJK toxin-antitoxin module